MKSSVSIVSVGGALALAASASAGILYQTGFNASEGYVEGALAGQQGWSVFQPSGSSVFAGVTFSAPAGSKGGALAFTSGTDASTSPRYAWPTGYGAAYEAAANAGEVVLTTSVDMYMASGSTSTARIGAVTFDATGAKILSGFYVQQNTGLLYMLAYYNNAGTFGNFAFNTGVQLGNNAWTTVTSTWDRWTGRTTVSWGGNSFYVDGAGIGSIADETDIYATRNGSAVAATVYFDDMLISTEVPAPGALALLGLAGVAGSRRRR